MALPLHQPQLSPPDTESQASPFSCTICHKTYTRVDHLARHVRSHTQEKPFSCPVCGKSFARADLLKRHGANHEDSTDGTKRRRLNQPQSRVAQACVLCAASKLRCSGEEPCKRCSQKNLECRYNKPRTSIVPDGSTIDPDQLDSASNTTHEEWHNHAIPTHKTLIGSPYQHQPQPISPSQSRGPGNVDHGPVRMVVAQPPAQLPTPSSSGQAMDLTTFADPVCEVGTAKDRYDSSFADFLTEIMGQDPMNSDPAQANPNLAKPFASFDLLDFNGASSFNFLGDNSSNNYATYAPYEPQDLHADTTRNNSAPQQAQSSSGYATPSAGDGGIRLGAEAFKDSIWLYAPSQNNFVGADKKNMFLPVENLLEKTRCKGYPPCDSLSAAVRDRILATVLAESTRHILPAVVASFPSAELLTNLIHQFLVKHERHDNAWIHVPTFNPNQQHPEFLMSVIGAGAATSEIPQIRNLGFAFQETARRCVTEQIERDNRTIRHLRPLQTYALHLDVGLWSGDRRRMELSESHSFILVTMIRRGGFFRQTSPKSPVPDIRDSPETIENKWKQWVERESFKRLAFHLLIRDAKTSIALITPPMVSPSEILVELPASADLWRAKSSLEWRDLFLARHAEGSYSHKPIPTLRTAADDLSLVTNYLNAIDIPLTNLLILCSLWSLSWQYRELVRLNISNPGGNSSLITKSLYSEICQALQRFRLYSSDWMSGSQPLAVVLHERVLLNLHASLEDVQLFAGKAGEDEARRIYPVLSAWAQSRESRQAVFHAGQIVRAAKDYTQGRLHEFSAVSLYHASLVFWAWAVVLNSSSSSSSPAILSGLMMSNSRENQQIVFVDGEDNDLVQRFIVLGKGCPALNVGDEKKVVPLTDAKGIMVAVTDLLRRNHISHAHGPDEELVPMVANLSKLMRSLGNAAKGIRGGAQRDSGGGETGTGR